MLYVKPTVPFLSVTQFSDKFRKENFVINEMLINI